MRTTPRCAGLAEAVNNWVSTQPPRSPVCRPISRTPHIEMCSTSRQFSDAARASEVAQVLPDFFCAVFHPSSLWIVVSSIGFIVFNRSAHVAMITRKEHEQILCNSRPRTTGSGSVSAGTGRSGRKTGNTEVSGHRSVRVSNNTSASRSMSALAGSQ
jgi:hypothetical protein